MLKKIFLILSFLPVLVFSKDLKSQAEDKLHEVLGRDITLEFEKYEISGDVRKKIEKKAKQKFIKSFVYLWRIRGQDIKSEYAILDVVRGKSATITVLSIFEDEGTIHSVHILKYKGEHGRAVTNEKWLAQFIGIKSDSDLSIGSEIDAVSGATISANSISRGVKKWIYLIDQIKK